MSRAYSAPGHKVSFPIPSILSQASPGLLLYFFDYSLTRRFSVASAVRSSEGRADSGIFLYLLDNDPNTAEASRMALKRYCLDISFCSAPLGSTARHWLRSIVAWAYPPFFLGGDHGLSVHWVDTKT